MNCCLLPLRVTPDSPHSFARIHAHQEVGGLAFSTFDRTCATFQPLGSHNRP